ncbi:trypsin-like peptidase domain-containing protein [Rhodovulum sp. DZ06]|uniref:S1C family serine protease n=1 Tax=Rhodovulum sp. DZ06 TaxID=3425126 RepID=UPI003D34805C
MSDSFFITKSSVDPEQMIEVGGQAALDQYEALRTFLLSKVGREAADLFAEPYLSRGNGAAPASVSWYAPNDGSAARLADLPEEQRAAAEQELRRGLAAVAERMSDPIFGPLIGGALMMAGPDDVWTVDGKPLLVNWGLAPVGAQNSLAERDRHYAATLGRFLPLAAAPALSFEEWRARGFAEGAGAARAEDGAGIGAGTGAGKAAAAGAAGVAAGAAATSAAASTEPDPAGTAAASPVAAAPVDDGPASAWRWRWIAPVALAILLVGLLVWLLLPGSLLYPERPETPVIADEAAAAAARASNDALEERIAELRGALDGAICTPTGELVLPGGLTPDGRRPLTPEQRAALPRGQDGPMSPAPQQADPKPLLPPSPQRLVQPQQGGADPVPLLETLEEGVALVLAASEQGSGHGTGFFITPELVITNHHVVERALNGGRVLVTSERLGDVRPAEVLATLGPMETTGGDFALLRVAGANGTPLTVRTPQGSLKLQQVIAAGYPGFAIASDQGFQRLMEGDRNAAPSLVVTDGIVNAEQPLSPQTRVLMHTAHISPGNSGGPLVDSCGAVVGVNTFIRRDQESLNSLNFSLVSADLLRFIDANGGQVTRSAEPCTPTVAAAPAAPAPAAPAPGDAAPAPAPAQEQPQ